jgi:hypothetical protein
VVDVRGLTSGAPQSNSFYPPVAVETLVPARAFGADVGGQLYPFALGPLTLGVGAGALWARGTTPAAAVTLWAVAPHVSANFGTGQGWSYISAGAGLAQLRTTVSAAAAAEPLEAGTVSDRTGGLLAIHAGAGARWFIMRRLAIGFDLRAYRLGAGTTRRGGTATPPATLFGVSAGFSIR